MPNDDIVERLRLIAKHVGRVKLGSRATLEPEFCNEISQWIIDGADEIERLRAELRTYTGDGHTLGEHLAREAL